MAATPPPATQPAATQPAATQPAATLAAPTPRIRAGALAAVAGLLGALAPQIFGVLGLALAHVPLILAACTRRGLNSACLAVPAALCAFAPEPVPGEAPVPGPVLVSGRVVTRLVVDDLRGDVRCVLARGPARVLCVLPRDTVLRPGDEVRAVGTLALRPSGMPIVTVPLGGVRRVLASRSLLAAAESMRLALHAALVRAVPGADGRLLAQLVLGHGGELDADIADAHRATGLSHLLAVSGAHVSLLAGMLTALVAGSSRRDRPPWLVLGAVTVYGTITGLDPPVVRALVGFALMLCAQRAGRRLPVIGALAAPGLLTALLAPNDATSASFALSYAAVAGLALAPVPSRPCPRLRLLAYAFLASAWATLATAPITLHLFGQVAPWTILATPILSPLVALLLALGLIVASLGALDAGVALLAAPLGAATRVYAASVEHLAQMPAAPVVAVSEPPLLALAGAAVLGLSILTAWPNRRGAASLCLALVLPHFVPWPHRASTHLRVLDVGHGQACLLRLPDGASVLVDCGSQHQPSRAARAVVRALAPQRRIDIVVLSHADADHCNGLPLLLQQARIGTLVLPAEMAGSQAAARARRAHVRVVTVTAGERLDLWSGLTITRPTIPIPAAESNDAGLWVHAHLGTFAVLLPGDAGERGVRAWLASPWPSPADVVLLPHHGRVHGAVTPLLDAVQPKLAIASGGVADRMAPQADAVRSRGIRLLETAQVGDVTVEASVPPRLLCARPEPLFGPPR